VFLEASLALQGVLGNELEQAVGLPLHWYDVLVHLDDSPEGIPMNVLADRILYSKSGLTRVVDRLEADGLVRRVRPAHERRVVLVVRTEKGTKTRHRAARYHRDGIERHFSKYLTDHEVKTLTHALEKVRAHARELRRAGADS